MFPPNPVEGVLNKLEVEKDGVLVLCPKGEPVCPKVEVVCPSEGAVV